MAKPSKFDSPSRHFNRNRITIDWSRGPLRTRAETEFAWRLTVSAYSDGAGQRYGLNQAELAAHGARRLHATPSAALVVPDAARHLVWVALRGTVSAKDIIADLHIVQAPFPTSKAVTADAKKPRVHSGHLGVLNGLLRDGLMSIITEQLAACPPSTQVVLTGHSMGGSLSLMLAVLLVEARIPVHAVLTWGAPTPGDIRFADLYVQTLHSQTLSSEAPYLGTFRFANVGDPVPRLLDPFPNYVHATPVYYLDDELDGALELLEAAGEALFFAANGDTLHSLHAYADNLAFRFSKSRPSSYCLVYRHMLDTMRSAKESGSLSSSAPAASSMASAAASHLSRSANLPCKPAPNAIVASLSRSDSSNGSSAAGTPRGRGSAEVQDKSMTKLELLHDKAFLSACIEFKERQGKIARQQESRTQQMSRTHEDEIKSLSKKHTSESEKVAKSHASEAAQFKKKAQSELEVALKQFSKNAKKAELDGCLVQSEFVVKQWHELQSHRKCKDFELEQLRVRQSLLFRQEVAQLATRRQQQAALKEIQLHAAQLLTTAAKEHFDRIHPLQNKQSAEVHALQSRLLDAAQKTEREEHARRVAAEEKLAHKEAKARSKTAPPPPGAEARRTHLQRQEAELAVRHRAQLDAAAQRRALEERQLAETHWQQLRDHSTVEATADAHRLEMRQLQQEHANRLSEMASQHHKSVMSTIEQNNACFTTLLANQTKKAAEQKAEVARQAKSLHEKRIQLLPAILQTQTDLALSEFARSLTFVDELLSNSDYP